MQVLDLLYTPEGCVVSRLHLGFMICDKLYCTDSTIVVLATVCPLLATDSYHGIRTLRKMNHSNKKGLSEIDL